MTRNSSLLAALSGWWAGYGCALCGTRTGTGASPGWRVELHHHDGRRGDDDAERIVGLCGELLPHKCHWRVSTHRVRIWLPGDLDENGDSVSRAWWRLVWGADYGLGSGGTLRMPLDKLRRIGEDNAA